MHYCNILTPTLKAIRVSFPFSWAAQPGAWGPSLSGTCSSIQPILTNWSDFQTAQSGAWGLPLLGACFLYRILSPAGLVSKLTDFLSSPSYIIVQRLLSCGRHNRTHSTHPRSRLYSDIPRADAPLIYIGTFPILTARPGRRSIYNKSTPPIEMSCSSYLTELFDPDRWPINFFNPASGELCCWPDFEFIHFTPTMLHPTISIPICLCCSWNTFPPLSLSDSPTQDTWMIIATETKSIPFILLSFNS